MEIRVSVRGLVEFLLRTGDIDNRKKSAPDDAMAEGSRIHRMIQKKWDPVTMQRLCCVIAKTAGNMILS